MPKEKGSVFAMLRGDEPGLLARIKHNLSGEDEGSWGEKCIVTLLKNRTQTLEVFQNVYIPHTTHADKTTELDIVIAAQTGIYVFESKAYGGKIYGRPEQLNWTQYLGGVKSTFYNPIRQNETHRRSLAKVLNVPLENILSFIVFENRADLSKLVQTRGDNFIVCNRNRLLKFLQMTTANQPIIFSDEELTEICVKLTQWSNVDEQTKKRHVKQVQQQTHGDTCPFCGCQLVIRQGKYGSFIGCSAYPRCKYVRKMD